MPWPGLREWETRQAGLYPDLAVLVVPNVPSGNEGTTGELCLALHEKNKKHQDRAIFSNSTKVLKGLPRKDGSFVFVTSKL